MAVHKREGNDFKIFTTSFQWTISKVSEMQFSGYIFSSEIPFLDDFKICLVLCKREENLCFIAINPLKIPTSSLVIHCELSFINPQGEEELTIRKIVTLRRKGYWEGHIYLDMEKYKNLLQADSLTIFCSLAAKEPSNALDATTQMVSCLLTDNVLSNDLQAFFLAGEDSDIKLKVKEIEFPAHRAILRSRSAVFRAMLQHDMIEKNNGVVNIDDCEPDCFRDYLIYLYSGKISKMSKENVIDLYWITDRYDAPELKAACLNFMMNDICVDTFFDYVTFALRHNESELLTSAKEFFKKNVKVIIRTAEWKAFNENNPTEATEFLIFGLSNVILVPDESNN